MINPFKEINWTPDNSDLRKFGLSLIIGFPCLSLVFFLLRWWWHSTPPATAGFILLGLIGACIGLLALLAPTLSRPFYLLWYGFAACVGIVVSNLILTLVYYLLFAPIGFFRRLLGNDPLQLRNPSTVTTFWHDIPETTDNSSYFSQS